MGDGRCETELVAFVAVTVAASKEISNETFQIYRCRFIIHMITEYYTTFYIETIYGLKTKTEMGRKRRKWKKKQHYGEIVILLKIAQPYELR